MTTKWINTLSAAIVALGIPSFSLPVFAQDGVLIGVVFPAQNQARWTVEGKIIAEQIEQNGDEVILQYSNESAATQKNQVESMIERGVKVLIIAAIDSKAGGGLVSQAQAQGIKVITYDRGVVDAVPDYAIERNNYENGVIHAKSALALAPKGDYALIRGDQSTLAQVDMSKAYDELLKGNPDINIVYDTLTPSWDTAAAQLEAEAALQKNPNIKAFVVMWDNGAQATIQALKSAGAQPGDVFVSGTDASTPSLALIAQGWQSETTWMPIDQMARSAADIAHALGSGGSVPEPDATIRDIPTMYIPLINVTKDNLCEFVTKIAPAGWVSVEEVYGAGVTTCK